MWALNVVEPGHDWRTRGQHIDDLVHGCDVIMMAILVDRFLRLRVEPLRISGIAHDKNRPGIDVILAVDLAEEVGFLGAPVAEGGIEKIRSDLILGSVDLRISRKPSRSSYMPSIYIFDDKPSIGSHRSNRSSSAMSGDRPENSTTHTTQPIPQAYNIEEMPRKEYMQRMRSLKRLEKECLLGRFSSASIAILCKYTLCIIRKYNCQYKRCVQAKTEPYRNEISWPACGVCGPGKNARSSHIDIQTL